MARRQMASQRNAIPLWIWHAASLPYWSSRATCSFPQQSYCHTICGNLLFLWPLQLRQSAGLLSEGKCAPAPLQAALMTIMYFHIPVLGLIQRSEIEARSVDIFQWLLSVLPRIGCYRSTRSAENSCIVNAPVCDDVAYEPTPRGIVIVSN